jgi:hypothetical protein
VLKREKTELSRIIRKEANTNKLLVILSLWYIIGVTTNILLHGNGLADWRQLIQQPTLLVGLWFTFLFSSSNKCHRYFTIGIVLVMGFQSIVSFNQMLGFATNVRDIWGDGTEVAKFGEQSYFTIIAVFLPIIFWTTTQAKGILRLVIMFFSFMLLIQTLYTTILAAISLVLFGFVILSLLSIFIVIKRFSSIWFIVFVIILNSAFFYYLFTKYYYNPLFDPVSSRITNLIVDYKSGGYEGEDAFNSSRWTKAEFSFNNFKINPYFGAGGGAMANNPYSGGHSSLFDNLAVFGLFGGGGALIGIIILTLMKAIKRFWRERNFETACALTSMILLVISGITNPYWSGSSLSLMFVLGRPFLSKTYT